MVKISVCLATFNEEKNLADCLKSVQGLADEIVIVDGTSTDKTVAIAKKYGAKVIVRENPPMFHLNKQKAFEAATGDWILYLDADERVTPELKKEISEVTSVQRLATSENKPAGFWLPRKNIIFGKWMEHTGWYPDYQLRLFRRGQAFLPCQTVHEQPVLQGQAGHLENPLWHENYQTISQFMGRLDKYTENDKNLFLAQQKKIEWFDAIRFPAAEFLKRFFREQGYKDGLHGLVLSLFQSFSAFVTFAKVWEAGNFKETDSQNFLVKTQKELVGALGEMRYWFLTAKVENTGNPVKKIWYRILRKTH